MLSDQAQWRRREGLSEGKKKASVNMVGSVRGERASGCTSVGRGSQREKGRSVRGDGEAQGVRGAPWR